MSGAPNVPARLSEFLVSCQSILPTFLKEPVPERGECITRAMPEILEESLDTISVLQAMYPLPTELEMSATTAAYLVDPSQTPPDILEIILNLLVDEDEAFPLSVVIGLPIKRDDQVKISPRQPAWLNRTQHDSLLSSIPPCDAPDAILDTLESVKASASILLHSTRAPTPPPVEKVAEVLERVWFWFPSLSTREKRRDLVEYAPRYGLTGFVLAGKPGLLCLEGDARQVDQYMSSIKSESWSDIPSHQKKVTERLRLPLTKRTFQTMREITDLVPHYGQYSHRGEMSEVKRLMEQWGVGDDFGAVVMNSAS